MLDKYFGRSYNKDRKELYEKSRGIDDVNTAVSYYGGVDDEED